jgi:hypothetical protein
MKEGKPNTISLKRIAGEHLTKKVVSFIGSLKNQECKQAIQFLQDLHDDSVRGLGDIN